MKERINGCTIYQMEMALTIENHKNLRLNIWEKFTELFIERNKLNQTFSQQNYYFLIGIEINFLVSFEPQVKQQFLKQKNLTNNEKKNRRN